MPIRILKKDKNKSEPKKRFDPRTGEETNKPGGKDPRTIYAPKPQIPPERQMRTGGLSPKQKAIASKAPPPNKITGADFAVLRKEKAKGRGMGLQDEKIKPGKVMKAREGKAIKKDPTKPVNPFQKTPKTTSKLPGRIGTALGIGAMMVPAAYAAAKQYKDYKSAKNRDKAKVKKYSLGGDILTQFKDIMTGSKDSKISKAKEGLKKQIAEERAKIRDKAKVKKYNTGGDIEVKQLDPLGKRLSDVGMMGGVGRINKFVLRNQKKAIQKIPNKNFKSRTTSGKEQKKLAIKEQKNIESKMTRKGQEYKPVITRSKGGGADTGKVGEIKSKFAVASDRLRRRARKSPERTPGPRGSIPMRLSRQDIVFTTDKSFLEDMKPPRGAAPGKFKSGTMVKARGCKLGRTRPTKIT